MQGFHLLQHTLIFEHPSGFLVVFPTLLTAEVSTSNGFGTFDGLLRYLKFTQILLLNYMVAYICKFIKLLL
jgi:hypothetical protein